MAFATTGWRNAVTTSDQAGAQPLAALERKTKKTLPGDRKETLAQMLRVNHAGEYGARRIYEGQLRVLKGMRHEKIIREMWQQEKEHLDYFSKALPQHRVRPTALLPFWHVAGYALGAASALLGSRAAMACTVAVEEVIDGHYAEQEAAEMPAELKEKIIKFRADECHHRDIGLEREAEQTPFYDLFTSLIKAGSKTAIWLSKRI